MYTSVLIESLCIKEVWIDDTIEIRIIILVEIFVGTKKHSEKKNNTHRINEYQDSNDSTSTTSRNVGCTFLIWDHKSFIFKKNKMESKPSPINGIIRENYRKQILFYFFRDYFYTFWETPLSKLVQRHPAIRQLLYFIQNFISIPCLHTFRHILHLFCIRSSTQNIFSSLMMPLSGESLDSIFILKKQQFKASLEL